MLKHTPGPWNDNGTRKNSPHGVTACAVWTADGETFICGTACSFARSHDADLETQDANARLIAKAPQMYALLQKFMNVYEHGNIAFADKWKFAEFSGEAGALLAELDK